MTIQGAVTATPEYQRVVALPRRDLRTAYDQDDIVARLTELLRLPQGTQRLRLVQARALLELGLYGGLFGLIATGDGKSLITFLAPYILNSLKTLLFVPGGLVRKTEQDIARYAAHWRIPTSIRIASYDLLGRKQAAQLLEDFGPDLIMGDEIQRLKNPDAAVTRRVTRYMEAHPETRFVALSGTMMSKSILDFAHILRWCLKGNAPIPASDDEVAEWASALDDDLGGRPGDELLRMEPGALLQLACPEELAQGPLTAARLAFRRRLHETPGVVATYDAEHVDATLEIHGQTYDLEPESDALFTKLRHDKQTPDGWELLYGHDVWRHAKELALGFHSIWDPRPPEAWLQPRKRWYQYVRAYLARSTRLDSPEQVEDAVRAGQLDDGGALAAWDAVRDTFVPNPVEIWHDMSVIKLAAEWAARAPGIVWCDHTFFARRLSLETGLPYYAGEGIDALTGRDIEHADPDRSLIASWAANHEGKNLQPWTRALIVSPPESARELQQGLARQHRPMPDGVKRRADEITVDVLIGCREHVAAWQKAYVGAGTIRDVVGGGAPKVTIATYSGVFAPDGSVTVPTIGDRW
jgi:hypothetical protein